jgi:hypothetical protein
MTYSISSVQLHHASGVVVSADWSFTTADGTLRSVHVLHTPPGDLTPDAITETVLIDWLRAQLPESEADMTASLKAEAQRKAEAASVVSLPLTAGQTLAAAVEQRRQAIAAQEEAARLYQQQMDALLQQIAAALPWDAATTYKLGDVVTHNDKVYRKSDESDNTEPDDVPGGWELVG